jgi:iron complex transport system substrate-binding protein
LDSSTSPHPPPAPRSAHRARVAGRPSSPFALSSLAKLICGSALALAVGLAPLVASCGPHSPDANSAEASTAAPTRVLPVSATAVDFVVALLPSDRLVGLPVQALEYSVLHDSAAPFGASARFDSYLAEPVLALAPDFVLADPYQAPETTQRLRHAGVHVVTLPVIASWSDARRTLLDVGEQLGAAERAKELCAELDARVERLGERAKAAKRWRGVVYSSFGGVGSTAGEGTTIDDVLRLAGLENAVAAQGRKGHMELGFEGLITLDPDLIVVSAPLRLPPSAQGDLGGASERVLLQAPQLASLHAVRERRIVALPAWLFATGSHEIVSAAEALRDALDALERRAPATR